MDIRKINDDICVCGQIEVADIAELKKLGFVTIINNRPDHEVEPQPTDAQMSEAAEAAGLNYHFLPVGREGLSPETLTKTAQIIQDATGPVFAFCRTGTRSTTVWALSQAGKLNAKDIIEQARVAGYDVSHLQPHLEAAQS